MSQLSDIITAQKNLEDCFTKRMQDLEAQIQGAAPGKETVAKVAEEFRTFRELMFGMLGLLRKQINECTTQIDAMETRHRRKAIIFLGVPEAEKENCRDVVLDVLHTKLGQKEIADSSITVCHRLGASNTKERDQQRPILVRFAQLDTKAAVWRAKTSLKGTNISVKEFLTKTQQVIFNKARQHFGVRSCWTQDGVILLKTADGKRHRVVSGEALDSIIAGYPTEASSGATSRRAGPAGQRKK